MFVCVFDCVRVGQSELFFTKSYANRGRPAKHERLPSYLHNDCHHTYTSMYFFITRGHQRQSHCSWTRHGASSSTQEVPFVIVSSFCNLFRTAERIDVHMDPVSVDKEVSAEARLCLASGSLNDGNPWAAPEGPCIYLLLLDALSCTHPVWRFKCGVLTNFEMTGLAFCS